MHLDPHLHPCFGSLKALSLFILISYPIAPQFSLLILKCWRAPRFRPELPFFFCLTLGQIITPSPMFSNAISIPRTLRFVSPATKGRLYNHPLWGSFTSTLNCALRATHSKENSWLLCCRHCPHAFARLPIPVNGTTVDSDALAKETGPFSSPYQSSSKTSGVPVNSASKASPPSSHITLPRAHHPDLRLSPLSSGTRH